MLRRRLPAAIAMAVALSSQSAKASGDNVSADATAWYSILTGQNVPIGSASHEVLPQQNGREIIDTQDMDVGERIGPADSLLDSRSPSEQMSSRTVRTEDYTGRTRKIDTISKVGRYTTEVVSLIENDSARVTRETPSGSGTAIVRLPSLARFDNGDDLLRTWNPVKTPQFEFDNFNTDSMTVEHVTVDVTTTLAPSTDGFVALRRSYQGPALVAVAHLLIDGHGRIVEVTQPMFQTSIITRLTDKTTALGASSMYRVLPDVMTKSPFLISDSAKLGHIRYRFSFQDNIEFSLPQTSEQRVLNGSGYATIDICADCGPGLPADAATLSDALKPTIWLQSDDPKLKEIAGPVAQLPITETQKMDALLERAKPYLRKIDFVGHFSALETVDRRSGDCTEASVLLAALGRAAGIPTLVVNGLVYSRESYHGVANTFMPHSWTLAFVDGKWRSFDLALDKFDSTHVALTIGDGDERALSTASQLAGLLHWDSMAEIRALPANKVRPP